MPLAIVKKKWFLVSARVFYYFPDHPLLITPNFFLRQLEDEVPELPALKKFLDWWQATLEGKVNSVDWMGVPLIGSLESVRAVRGTFTLQ